MYKNPAQTVDLIIEVGNEAIVIVERSVKPFGWSLPGGHVEYGETLWDAAMREAKEETGLNARLLDQFYTYSDPARNPGRHVITTVFIARGLGVIHPGSDAKSVRVCPLKELPVLEFDHSDIVNDYVSWKINGERPKPERRVSIKKVAVNL